MLQSLLSQARSNGIGLNVPNEHIEAVIAERNFFREKYAAQIVEMEQLHNQLKESQRIIDRLRKKILDLEMERCGDSRIAHGTCAAVLGGAHGSAENNMNKTMECHLSSTTSLTSITCGEEESRASPTSNVSDHVESHRDKYEQCDDIHRGECIGLDKDRSPHNTTIPHSLSDDAKQDIEEKASHESEVEEADPHKDSISEKEEADQIRANAERMLIWANYQTNRRPTSINIEGNQEDERSTTPGSKVVNMMVYDISESLNKNLFDSYDDFSLNSPISRNNEPHKEIPNTDGVGTFKRFIDRCKDLIDPPMDDEVESEAMGSDEDSISHRSFDL